MALGSTMVATYINVEASERLFKSLPQDTIRLVHLQPGSDADDIVCRLEQPKLLSESLSYNALSYMWGTFDTEEYIYLRHTISERFRVTPRLALALRMLRDSKTEVTFWIDALCINQTNKAEQAEQIPLMGRIYRGAQRVVAFLGAHKDGSQELFDFLKDMEAPERFEWDFDVLCGLQPAERTLLGRQYWQRAWIVQELVLASEIYLQCGKDRISFKTLKWFHDKFVNEPIRLEISKEDTRDNIRDISYLNTWHRRFDQLASTKSDLSIDSFLDGFLESQCGNPRDHIYAFYNLLPRKLQQQISINYNTPADEVIRQAMKAIIKVTQCLDIITLRSRQVQSAGQWQDALPSWCPFLGVPYMTPTKSADDEEDLRSRGSSSDGIPTVSFLENGTLLRLEGFVLGRICERLSRHPPATCPFENLKPDNEDRLYQEGRYAYECIEFIRRPDRRGKVDLDETVLGTALDSTSSNGLLACLETTKGTQPNQFTTPQIAQMNSFSRSFHGMQLCTFSCDNVISAGGVNPALNWLEEKEGEEVIPVDFAIVPQAARKHDRLCAIQGCHQLVVLRRVYRPRRRFYRSRCRFYSPRHQFYSPRCRIYSVVGGAKLYDRTGHDIISWVGVDRLRTFTLV
ncbi:hypothetical protein ASPVEDRAFT_238459 [Aspergillus versicolor CBS 583.65]|uniref:Heterokaryon incompatibility domain-containing protein n=1 Tax=Aspergillus versicolor CBS 583.65 TaxID=1036611 RepID=A0A1L9P4N0_ASPVE|nr:uncharacterized protein ASPVEDRAFT_238459 [Aspergillus versicolor CBS 583.65]OJI96458.1 hypothetical protein ASPVEDRAFT_238459 [Aspergillus versicolor CBS 583.65]